MHHLLTPTWPNQTYYVVIVPTWSGVGFPSFRIYGSYWDGFSEKACNDAGPDKSKHLYYFTKSSSDEMSMTILLTIQTFVKHAHHNVSGTNPSTSSMSFLCLQAMRDVCAFYLNTNRPVTKKGISSHHFTVPCESPAAASLDASHCSSSTRFLMMWPLCVCAQCQRTRSGCCSSSEDCWLSDC